MSARSVINENDNTGILAVRGGKFLRISANGKSVNDESIGYGKTGVRFLELRRNVQKHFSHGNGRCKL